MEQPTSSYEEQQERQRLIKEIREMLNDPQTRRGYHLFLADQNSKKVSP